MFIFSQLKVNGCISYLHPEIIALGNAIGFTAIIIDGEGYLFHKNTSAKSMPFILYLKEIIVKIIAAGTLFPFF
jgi:hypothetical protein